MFSITLSNEKCKIKLTSAKDGAPLGSVTGVKIKRRELGDTSWTVIYTQAITSVDDFNYTFLDKYTRSRRTYEYKVIPMIGSTEETAVNTSIECNFDELYITDFATEYSLFLNADFDYDGHGSSVVQELMNSRTPIIIENAMSDYITGYVDAIPLPLDANGNPTSIGAQKYKEQFISFLKNKKNKYIKTNEGEAWLVYIHEPPKRNKAEAEGAASIKFSFTEIGDSPTHDEG